MTKEIVTHKILSDEEIKDLEGDYIPQKIVKKCTIVNYDCDVYCLNDKNEKQLLGKFRKNVFSPELCKLAKDNFLKAAKTGYNRGTAAGPIDKSRLPKDVHEFRPMRSTEKGVKNTKNWTYYVRKDGTDAKNQLSNATQSGLVGYYEKARGLPCRLTSYTRDYFEKYKKGLPYLQAISEKFRELIPDRWELQYKRAMLTPDYSITDTAFSTVTINKNFRTSIHKDAGDFEAGYGNLTVISENYQGGYTIFPQWGVGFDVRTGDFLAMDVHQFHGNTELKSTCKNGEEMLRLSFVCYLRKGMHICK